MAMQTLTAVFTSRDGAIAAASELRRRGLSSTVALSPEAATRTGAAQDGTGFRAWLRRLLGSAADRAAYAEALGRGETVLTAVVAAAAVYGALGVLDHHLSTRIDRCQQTWRDTHDDDAWARDGAPHGSHRPRAPTDQASPTRMAHDLPPMRSDGGTGAA